MKPVDGRTVASGSRFRSRVAVVGSGPAGTTVARELSENGVDVILLEAGGPEASAAAQDTLKGSGPHQALEPLDKAREKRLGGTSHRWGGRTFPFDELDFEARLALGIDGWPMSREEMLPYYRRAAAVLELGAFDWTAHTAVPGEPEHLLRNRSHADLEDRLIWRWSPPVKFGEVVRRELADQENCRIFSHATVTKLVKDADSGRIIEAVCKSGKSEFSVVADDFVLAAGGVETARMLLANDLGNEHDQVGRNYMIHPIGEVGTLRLRDPKSAGLAVRYARTSDGVWARRLLQLSTEVRREEDLLNLGLAIWYVDPMEPGHRDPLLSSFALARKALTKFGGFKATGMHRRFERVGGVDQHLANVFKGFPQLIGFAGRWLKDRILSTRTLPSFWVYSHRGEYRLRFDAEQSPDPQSRVMLSDERDGFGVPRIVSQHSVSVGDRQNYLKSLRRIAETIEATGWAEYVPPSEAQMLEMQMSDATHQMGVVRMGTAPESSVLDADLRVWSIPNLYCATAGAFPSAGMAGPTLTVVALATRLADHLIATERRSTARIAKEAEHG
ncbi:GMC family oxidoreductase [Arthrobacter russicus]|uniref:GMC family oxidoreductase n=1 Tax=Arthrobacter russicus TaxID=172040 RepID=UPI00286C8906|nr:GMC family oxidoreductase [Arthrobacter russicus]